MLSKFGLFAELINLTICPIYDSLLPILYMLSLRRLVYFKIN